MLLFLILTLALIVIAGCKKDENNPTEPTVEKDSRLVGTWDLTKITIPLFNDSTLTPEEAGVQITITFNSDGSFTSVTIDSTGQETDNGNWSTKDNKHLTLKFNDGTSQDGDYSINGSTASLNWVIDMEGLQIPAILDFIKAGGTLAKKEFLKNRNIGKISVKIFN